MTEEDCIFTCPQCPKIFATRSNLKRHMENPNIHNIPYARSRDQKRWKGHSKKVSSRAETTERMRKWRAENRDKNKRNDLRCRVYRLARQKYGEEDSEEKQQFINEEINRRLGRRMLFEQRNNGESSSIAQADNPSNTTPPPTSEETLNELPFYCAPLHKIELPSINMNSRRPSQSNTEPSGYNIKSQPPSPMSDDNSRRHSECSTNSVHSHTTTSASPIMDTIHINTDTTTTTNTNTNTNTIHNNINDTLLRTSLPPMQTFLSHLNPHSHFKQEN